MSQSIAKQDLVFKLAQKRVNSLLSDVASHLATSGELSDKLIHDVRVCVKRLRALLQLYRPCCNKQTIKRIDHDIKAIANAFAGQRDMVVQYQLLSSAIDEIQQNHQHDFAPLRAYFLRVMKQEKAASPTLMVDKAFKRALKKWQKHLKMTGRKSVDSGLHYTHDQCYTLAHRAIATGQDALYHAARKWIKYYLYQLKLLNKKQIDSDLELAINQLDEMGEWLGELHDQSVLEQTLKALISTKDKPAEIAHVENKALEATIHAVLNWLATNQQHYKQQFWSQFNAFFLTASSSNGHMKNAR